MSEFIGKNHTDLLQWLSQTWLQNGAPICFVEGFPGVGKSSLAIELMKLADREDRAAVMLPMPDVQANSIDDLLLSLSTELTWAGHDKLADAVAEGTSLEGALAVVLRRPVLIVVDEFQRALDPETGQLVEALEKLFINIARRPTIPGRMLFLTNRSIAQEQWSEPYEKRRLSTLTEVEAEQLFVRLLHQRNSQMKISPVECRNAVKCLGQNPRAIQILVENLDREPLEELIGSTPQDWELRDREVSEYLVYDLERRLLEKTLAQLSPETMTFLQQISVHRKPPKRKAMEHMLPAQTKSKGKKALKQAFKERYEELRTRLLIKQQYGWYNLHPVAREIALQRLRAAPAELREAHSKAADFFVKPFDTSNQPGSKLGGFFVEARYHLVRAGRERELGKIAQNFENHLRAIISLTSIPQQSDELNEAIAVFSGLVESTCSEEFEEYLARLLQTRNREGDLQRALTHAQRATSIGFHTASWLLRADLERKLHDDLETALATYRAGIGRVLESEDVQPLYERCTDLLLQLDRREDAIELLEEGVREIRSERELAKLYQQGTKLIVQTGDTARAIFWLKAGIDRLTPSRGLTSLYCQCAKLLAQNHQFPDAIKLFKEGIDRIPPEHHLATLYQRYAELLASAGQVGRAIRLLRDGIHTIPRQNDPLELYEYCATLLVKSGDVEGALDLLREHLQALQPVDNPISFYYRWGNLLVQLGAIEGAVQLLREGISSIPASCDPGVLYHRCGQLLVQLGQVDEAITLLEMGIQKTPTGGGNIILFEQCGQLFAKTGQTEKALALFKTGIHIFHHDPRAVEVISRYTAQTLEDTNQKDETVNLLKNMVHKTPDDHSVRILYLECSSLLSRLNRLDEAIDILKAGIERVPSSFKLHISYSKLLVKSNRIDEAIDILKAGIDRVYSNKNQQNFYLHCSILLTKSNRIDEAIDILKAGIEHIPPTQNLLNIYIRCSSLLEKKNRIDEAIDILKRGIERIPVERASHTLYIFCSRLLEKKDRIDEAIDILKIGIKNIYFKKSQKHLLLKRSILLVQKNIWDCAQSQKVFELRIIVEKIGRSSRFIQLFILAKSLLAQMQQNWQEAAEIAQQGALKYPTYHRLVSQAAFCWLCSNNLQAAQKIIQNIQANPGSSPKWLQAFIALRTGDLELAQQHLSTYLNRPVKVAQELNEAFLLALWDNSVETKDTSNISFYFPTLPPTLTGLAEPVTRRQYGPPVLPNEIKMMPNPTPERDRVFISYSHKDDKWLQALQTHLAPFIRVKNLQVWDDTHIPPGAKWKPEIEMALAATKVAVLLVSPDFLASKFINEEELPAFLDAAEKEGLKILWIPVRPSSYKLTKINDYQSVYKPNRPLSRLTEDEQEEAWVEICDKIQATYES